MKQINKLFLIGLVFLAVSCLDRFPEDQITEASFFKTSRDFDLYTNSFYGSLPSYNLADLESDLLRAASPNSVSSGTFLAVGSDGTWNGSYSLIRSCNFFLSKSDGYEDKESIKASVGATKFFRGMAYFGLLKRFGGVPLVTSVLDVDSEELFASRNTREEVVALIVADLQEAVTLLPEAKDISSANHGKISKEGAQAFLARVALFEGTWRKYTGGNGDDLLTIARNMSKSVIDGGQFELFKSDALGERSYQYLFSLDNAQSNPAFVTEAENKEFVIVAKYDRDLRRSNRDNRDVNHSVTRKLADMFLCADGLPIDKSPLFQGKSTLISEFEDRDLRMINDLQVPHQQYWKNGSEWGRDWSIPESDLGDPSTSQGWLFWHELSWSTRTTTGYSGYKHYVEGVNNTTFGGDYGTLRLAEIYLIYAESVFELDGAISDSDLDISINKLRERVDMPALTNAFVSQNSLDMKEEIRRERTIELCFEGFRYDDLRRWHTAHIELNKPVLGVKYKGTEFETYEFSKGYTGNVDGEGYILAEPASERSYADKHYLFPLPLKQIQINPNLEQNPGW